MTALRLSLVTFVGATAALAALVATSATPDAEPQPPARGKADTEIIQKFPSKGAQQTAWKIRWGTCVGNGLYIASAHFKRGPKEPWMQVLGDARLSEMIVPYHSSTPRFFDVSYNFELTKMTAADAGPYGKLLGNPPTVVQELRDRGLMWKDRVAGARRGEVLILWGSLDAGNYQYVTEYGFQDDGTVTFRAGSTGHNYSSREYEPHMHTALWRINVNLFGENKNAVSLMEHVEKADMDGRAKTVHTAFNNGKEGFADWNPLKFTMLRVYHTRRKNARGEPVCYDLMPMRMGSARHYGGENEECTHHDFWVTRNRSDQTYYPDVTKYVAKHESIENADVVLWYSSPMHHEPRSEDGEMVNDRLRGVTHVGWSQFCLRPSNVFDRTPFFPREKK
jgi:primary-amine oxidase